MTTPTPLDARDFPIHDLGFHHVLGSMPGVAYVETEGSTGMTSYVSPRIRTLTGYPPERFVESRDFWYSIVHPDDRQRVEAGRHRRRRHRGTASRGIPAGDWPDDRIVWVRDEAVHVDASDDRPADPDFGLIVDITREREAESRAADVEQRYRTLIEQLPIVTYIDVPDESLGNLFVSPQINDLLGMPPPGPRVTSGRSGSIRRTATERGARPWRASAPAEPFTLEYRMVRDDGHVIWVRDSATTVRDAHGEARVRPRILLRHHQAEGGRTPARGSGGPIPEPRRATAGRHVHGHGRRRDGLDLHVSPQVETILGLSTSTFVTDDAWAAHLHPDDREDAVRGIHEAVRAGLPFTLEYRMIRPDGSVVWIRDQGNVVKGEDGKSRLRPGTLRRHLRAEAARVRAPVGGREVQVARGADPCRRLHRRRGRLR